MHPFYGTECARYGTIVSIQSFIESRGIKQIGKATPMRLVQH